MRYSWRWNLSDLPELKEDAPTVFSTFACGGGSSMGYKRAGYRVLGNCEIDPAIAEIYSDNLHPQFSFVEDIREFNQREDLPSELYSLDVLDGSPPCSTFSMIGQREKGWGVEKRFREGQKLQRLDDLFFVFLETVAKLQPRVFVAENVVGLISGNAKQYAAEIIRQARAIGYSVQLFVIDAAKTGVPQKRERVFFVGTRENKPPLVLDFHEPVVTFGEVRTQEPGKPLGDGALTNAFRRHWHDGETSLKDAGTRVKGRNSYFGHTVLVDEKPARTIMVSGLCIRACDGTQATARDLLNASSFPQDYKVPENKAKFICGMSVPPSMMANIAHEIREQWLEV